MKYAPYSSPRFSRVRSARIRFEPGTASIERRMRLVQLIGAVLIGMTLTAVPMLLASGAQVTLAGQSGAAASAGEPTAAVLSALGTSMQQQRSDAAVQNIPTGDSLSQFTTVVLVPFAHRGASAQELTAARSGRTPVTNSDVLLL